MPKYNGPSDAGILRRLIDMPNVNSNVILAGSIPDVVCSKVGIIASFVHLLSTPDPPLSWMVLSVGIDTLDSRGSFGRVPRMPKGSCLPQFMAAHQLPAIFSWFASTSAHVIMLLHGVRWHPPQWSVQIAKIPPCVCQFHAAFPGRLCPRGSRGGKRAQYIVDRDSRWVFKT